MDVGKEVGREGRDEEGRRGIEKGWEGQQDTCRIRKGRNRERLGGAKRE